MPLPNLVIHNDATEDILGLAKGDPQGIELLFRFLQELQERPDILSRLFTKHYEDNLIHVDSFAKLRVDHNVWRIKVKGLDMHFGTPIDELDSSKWMPYRVFHAPDQFHRNLYILAVVRRSNVTYDIKAPRNQKLLATCLRLGLTHGPAAVH